jgi:hypothetical protein
MQQCFATINHNTASLDMLGECFLNIGAIGRLWLLQHRTSKSTHVVRFSRRVDNFVMRKLLMQEEFSDAAGVQSAGGCPFASDVLT